MDSDITNTDNQKIYLTIDKESALRNSLETIEKINEKIKNDEKYTKIKNNLNTTKEKITKLLLEDSNKKTQIISPIMIKAGYQNSL
jgi:hypothetical protein